MEKKRRYEKRKLAGGASGAGAHNGANHTGAAGAANGSNAGSAGSAVSLGSARNTSSGSGSSGSANSTASARDSRASKARGLGRADSRTNGSTYHTAKVIHSPTSHPLAASSSNSSHASRASRASPTLRDSSSAGVSAGYSAGASSSTQRTSTDALPVTPELGALSAFGGMRKKPESPLPLLSSPHRPVSVDDPIIIGEDTQFGSLASPPATPDQSDQWKDFKMRRSPFHFGTEALPQTAQGAQIGQTAQINQSAQVPSAQGAPVSQTTQGQSTQGQSARKPPTHTRASSSSGGLGRSFSHVFHRHRRSASGAKQSASGSTPGSAPLSGDARFDSLGISIARSPRTPRTESASKRQGRHFRTQSEHSTSAYATPPLPSSSGFHNRSFSESTDSNLPSDQVAQAERDLRLLKAEINTLSSSKTTLLREIQSLKAQKRSLAMEISGQRVELQRLTEPARAAQAKVEAAQAIQVPAQGAQAPTQSKLDPALSPEVSEDAPAHKRAGFMRRFFGYNAQQEGEEEPRGLPKSFSMQSISAPLNVRQGGPALESMRGHRGRKEPDTDTDGALSAPMLSVPTLSAPTLGNPALYSQTLEERAAYEHRDIPYIISACLAEVTRRGLICEGIYRVSGSAAEIDRLERFFVSADSACAATDSAAPMLRGADIHAVAGLLKRYLKKLPNPVIPYAQYEHFLRVCTGSAQDQISVMKQILTQLPHANWQVLSELTAHLGAVAANQRFTKMTTGTLATVFAPTLARADGENPQREILDNAAKTRAIELMLVYSQTFFAK